MAKKRTITRQSVTLATLVRRFVALDGRVGRLELRFDVLHREMHERFDRMEKSMNRRFDEMFKLLDGFIGRIDKQDKEFSALSLQLERLEKRVRVLEMKK